MNSHPDTFARGTFSFLLILLLALLSGCGGSGDSSSAATLSKAQMIKAGDAICQDADKVKNESLNAYLKENPQANKGKASPEAVARVAMPPLEDELEGLKELGTPQSGASEYEAMVAALESGIATLEAKPLSILKSATNPLTEADQLANQYGFKVCMRFL